ncbi:fasciculation and elongation protein zeta-2-like protein [Dinothrombium tinctorium]|uniref:Fasciculation and elongation protein zeta-2-like protein n=1 Tax=Dinothrombium tinctorium TaxID=1965070 RepID=A0A3S3P178_9ACAR|nr:fasciculation and elongation protein zeta-2-like protein [Dinothrombium tinctorium]
MSIELSVEAPLAKTEDFPDFGDYQSCDDFNNRNNSKNCGTNGETVDNSGFADITFKDTISGSLEDLVNTFDEKITNCFRNYDDDVEKLAPVQVRTQEDLINECQMWWTLTGNFGNVLPIDWSKTYARKLQLPALNLNEQRNGDQNRTNANDLLLDSNIDEEELEELAKDLDLHSLILHSLQQEPIFTAEQVLEEIDEIMQEASPTDSNASEVIEEKSPKAGKKKNDEVRDLMYEEKLRSLTIAQLNELYIELETMIQAHSETLIQELALRDELEFEKELKNTFISLLLGIQNKRRQHHIDRKKGRGSNEPKYLTTVIPYNPLNGPPDVATLQVLIKILKAVNEDSPTVPTLLTDFILKVLCPT